MLDRANSSLKSTSHGIWAFETGGKLFEAGGKLFEAGNLTRSRLLEFAQNGTSTPFYISQTDFSVFLGNFGP